MCWYMRDILRTDVSDRIGARTGGGIDVSERIMFLGGVFGFMDYSKRFMENVN
jgi:hypothetical protein